MRYRYRPPRRHRRGRRHEPAAVLLVTEDDPLLVRAAAALAHAAWRYRSELAPLTVTVLLALCGTWMHARHPGWAIGLAVLTATVTAALAIPPARWPVGRWASRWPLVARPAERLYAASVTGVAGAWLAAATAFGPGTPPLPTVAALGTLAAGLPWWIDRRRRARVRVARIIERWPTFAEAIGLPGSRIQSAVVDKWGWTARLALRRGQTAQHVVNAAGAIASALAVPPGGVRVEPDASRADRALLRVVETDPHARPIPWKPAAIQSVVDLIELGLFEDGSPVMVRLLYRNTLVGGIVGSGKSGVLNVLLAALAGCLDVVIWGIDLKGGMELRPWAGCLDRLATTPADAVALLRDAIGELDRRAALLTATEQRLWRPTSEHPALLIVFDEYAELPDAAHAHADSLARRGRAVAVNLLAATQRPTQRAMGHGAVRSQMDVRICLRVREPRDTDLILGQGKTASGWHAHALDAPGKFLISDPEHDTPRRARACLITDHDVTRTVARNATGRPRLSTESAGGAPDATANQPDHPDPSRGDGTADAEAALWVALRDAADAGLSVADLERLTGMGRRWVYYRLRRHAQAGRAVQTARGRWRATHAPTGNTT
jgi:S-DNA-T family DNA segregation ATPase FtsK/SpoIIIE